MGHPIKTFDPPPVESGTKVKMEIVVNPSASWFTKALGLSAVLLLVALAFVFSLLVFAIFAALVLVMLARVWWTRKRVRNE